MLSPEILPCGNTNHVPAANRTSVHDLVAFQLVVKRGPIDSQRGRRLFNIAVLPLECGNDCAALQFAERNIWNFPIFRLSGIALHPGKILLIEHAIAAGHDRPLDDIFQFPDITWPVISNQQFQGGGRDAITSLPNAEEMCCTKCSASRECLRAARAAGAGESRSVEAVVEVFTESFLAHFFRQVFVGGSDDSTSTSTS